MAVKKSNLRNLTTNQAWAIRNDYFNQAGDDQTLTFDEVRNIAKDPRLVSEFDQILKML